MPVAPGFFASSAAVAVVVSMTVPSGCVIFVVVVDIPGHCEFLATSGAGVQVLVCNQCGVTVLVYTYEVLDG